jgi:tRNA(His) 5'-end guanylyltransferase
MKYDKLGIRMKTYYENAYRTFLPRRTNVIIRLDGQAFHTYNKLY